MTSDLLSRHQVLLNDFVKIKPALNLPEKQKEQKKLAIEMEDPEFWNTPEKAQKTSQQNAFLTQYITTWQEKEAFLNDFPDLLEMSESALELEERELELSTFETQYQKQKIQLLLSNEYDSNDVILSIHTGNGGQDAEEFSQQLLRMYLRWAEQNNYKSNIIEESPSDVGLKSATIEISGPFAYGYLQSEHGTQRLIRQSPFNAKGLRQTSFSRVEILPKIETDAKDIIIDENDLKIDVYRSSGAGGQSVNTTDSAVRVTHIPTNTVVTCQNERSQIQNKATALQILKSKLAKIKLDEDAQKKAALRGEILDNSFGAQIRTYTLHPYKMVKDHRTNVENSNPEAVLSGSLEEFIQAYLQWKT